MASIRRILNVFSREVKKRDDAALLGDDLISFVRSCQDPLAIDQALQQAGPAPFWPQDARMRLFYQSAQQDRPLAARLKAAAELGAGARRHALAHLQIAPDPLMEARLPRRRFAHLHLVSVDPLAPEDSESFMRLMQQPRTGGMKQQHPAPDIAAFGGDVTAAVAAGHDRVEALRHLAMRQLGDMLRLWLQLACHGAVPAQLDGAYQQAMQTAVLHPKDAAQGFAALRIAIAAAPRLPAADRASAMDMVELLATLVARLHDVTIEPLFTCRDDRDLVLRGHGDRAEVESFAAFLPDDMAAALRALAAHMARRLPADAPPPVVAVTTDMPLPIGLAVTKGEKAPAVLDDRANPCDALAELAIFARLIGRRDGNRGLRRYWQACEEAGVPSRLGQALGLMLGDLQMAYEQLTRRDVYHDTPDLRRVQDRMMARPLQHARVDGPAVIGNDSA